MGRFRVLLALPLVLAACGAPADPQDELRTSSPATSAAAALPAVPGLTAEAVRLRTDEAVGGRFQVRVTAAAAFTVTSVALDVPGFAELPPTPVTAEFVPGRVIDLPTPYGAVDCATAPSPAAARLTVVRPGGEVEDVTVPLAGDVPARVHEEECAGERVAAVVDVAVTGLTPGNGELTGRLDVRRLSGDQPVALQRLGRSVLVEVAANGLPLELAADARTAAVPVTFRPATCEPHVLSETKQPYVFPVEVALGDDAAVTVDLPVDDALRAALAALVRSTCTPR